ncbi:MAG TPA: trehalose-phosphatase [Ilumatobacteraceae bacterium]|nr:trehalose-phosphatase [Ilumatobacteraceae bacterium]
MSEYDDPATLADLVAALPRPLLLGLDVDGVLAPLVDHADDAVLLPGIGDAVSAAAALDAVHLAVVSGRSVDGLTRFEFGPDVHVIGSHGMETRDRAMTPLHADETSRLAELDALALDAAAEAGDGAWVERKPASVVLHVRRAEPDRGRRALSALEARARQVDGATSKAGSNVLELFARSADKGTALVALAADLDVRTVVFVGDDVTDEDAFSRLGEGDVAIKVGDAPTIAAHRLADPDAVLAWLRAIATA